MANPSSSPATKDDVRLPMQEIGKLYDANERWKDELIPHFDVTVKTIRHDVQAANKDRIENLEDRIVWLEYRVGMPSRPFAMRTVAPTAPPTHDPERLIIVRRVSRHRYASRSCRSRRRLRLRSPADRPRGHRKDNNLRVRPAGYLIYAVAQHVVGELPIRFIDDGHIAGP
jgi:hypothetical protein